MPPDTQLPKVSLVIPTYNTGRYILEALASLEQQTYKNLEIIVVDDGSTDNTAELLEAHGGSSIRFHQANAGQSAAMNFGWKQSSGAFLGYLSADDRLHPEAVATVVATLLENPSAVLAYPDFDIIDEFSATVRTVRPDEYSEERLVANFQCLPGPGALFRREAWIKTGDWNSSLRSIPDMDFFLRLCQFGPFVRVDRVVAEFRIHSGSTTYSPSTAERADEPVRVIQALYSSPDLSPSMLKWQNRSTANALMLSGFMHGFSGRYLLAFKRMAQAAAASPSALFSKKMLSYILGILKSKHGA